MSFAKLRPRRGTASQWIKSNPVLAEGELGVEVPDTGVGTGLVNMKIGDGVTAWNKLPYAYENINNDNTAINLIPYPYLNTTKVSNGITFTDNGDGTLTVQPGTVSSNTDAVFFLFARGISSPQFTDLNGTFTFTCCPKGGDLTYFVSLSKGTSSNSLENYGLDIGNGITFNTNTDSSKGERLQIYITIKKGTVISTPITFKPMLEKGTVAHDYVPYIGADNFSTAISNNKSIISDAWISTKTYSVGEYCINNNQLWKCLIQNTGMEPSEGTYWTSCTVGSEIDVLNDKLSTKTLSSSLVTMRSGYISNSISIIKSGNILSLAIDFKGSTSSSIKTGENKIADIDSSIRPFITSTGAGRITHSSGEVNEASCIITNSGEVRFHCTDVGISGLITATYIIE